MIPFSKTVHFKTMIAEVTDIEIKHTLKVTEEHTIEGDILVDGTYKMTEASQLEEEFHYTLPFTIEVDDKYNIESADINIHDFYFEIINEEDLKVNVELEITQVEEKEEIQDEVKEEVQIEEIDEFQEEEELLEESNEEEGNRVDADIETETVDGNASFLELDQVPKKVEILEEINQKEKANTNISTNTSTPSISGNEESEGKEEKIASSVSSIFSSINQEETFVTYHVYIVREQDTIDSITEKYQTTREAISAYNDLTNVQAGSKIIIPCSNE